MQTLGKVYYNACFVAVLSGRPLMLCSSTQCSHACVVVLALVPGYNIFGVWEKLPFPDFLGRFASRQAASGISECSVAASLLLEFSSARFSNRRISECSVAASLLLEFPSARFSNRRIWECSGVVALADEPAGLQHSSLHSSLILSSSIFVKHLFETIHDSAWQCA